VKLINLYSNRAFEAEIVEVDDEEFEMLRNSDQFEFDWYKEKGSEVYKIVEQYQDTPEIFGLISISDITDEFRIHINLVENSNDNKGKNKKNDRVAGCLLAFACSIAFERGYLGFTSLVPKTELIGLYVNKYGFQQYGRQLVIDQQDAIGLIKKYL
jgi:hypothetical protein